MAIIAKRTLGTIIIYEVDSAPTHDANNGSISTQTNGDIYKRKNNVWSPLGSGGGISRGHIDDLLITWNSSSQVQIGLGSCASSDHLFELIVTSPIVINKGVSGLNGIDTGAWASSNWYAVYVIYNPVTFTYGGLFSLDFTNPVLPSGYTKKRRVGCVRSSSASNILGFSMTGQGRYRLYNWLGSYLLFIGQPSSSLTRISISALSPPTVESVFLNTYLKGNVFITIVTAYLYVESFPTGNKYFTSSLYSSDNLNSIVTNNLEFLVAKNDPQAVWYKSFNAQTSTTFKIYIHGFRESL